MKNLFKIFKSQKSNEKNNTKITLELNARLQPMHRYEIEDAIEETLQDKKIGSVDGGGSLMNKNSEISCCDITINCAKKDIMAIVEILKNMPIPKGSFLYTNEAKIELGNLEGVGFYFSNELSKDIYENSDINVVIENFNDSLEGISKLFSYIQNDSFTALYYYGDSFEKMKKTISNVANTYPLCKNAKIEQIS